MNEDKIRGYLSHKSLNDEEQVSESPAETQHDEPHEQAHPKKAAHHAHKKHHAEELQPGPPEDRIFYDEPTPEKKAEKHFERMGAKPSPKRRSGKTYLPLMIYSDKITQEENRKMFYHLSKKKLPMFEFIDLAWPLSFGRAKIIVKKEGNTINMFVENKNNALSYSPLIFPFKMGDPEEIELKRGMPMPFPFFVSRGNFLDFMAREGIEEMRLSINRFMGFYYATGTAIGGGLRRPLLLRHPNRFLEIELEKRPSFYIELLKPILKTVHLHSNEALFENKETSIGLDNFNVFQHGLIVGTSGTGKSKFIAILVAAMKQKYGDQARIVVLDPQGEFTKTMKGGKIVDFVNNYIEPLNTGKEKTPLTTQLIVDILASAIGAENKYSERVAFYSVHLLVEIDKLTLENINLLLTDTARRMEFVSSCQNDEIKRFFDEEFNDIYMHHFNDAILPILNFIGEYMLYLGSKKTEEVLYQLIEDNELSVISFNPHVFGRRMVKFFANAIVSQMYTLAITGLFKRPTVLIVDEFPIVESRLAREILSETRKFNLHLYVATQFLNQIRKEVLDSIITNTKNVVAFRSNKNDAEALSAMMDIKVEEAFKKKLSPSELEVEIKEMFVILQDRECIVRLFDGKRLILPMKTRTVDMDRWIK
ncbi:MAG: DUF87 domain-containing protein [Candidatus Micrarchaeota archaeon]